MFTYCVIVVEHIATSASRLGGYRDRASPLTVSLTARQDNVPSGVESIATQRRRLQGRPEFIKLYYERRPTGYSHDRPTGIH